VFHLERSQTNPQAKLAGALDVPLAERLRPLISEHFIGQQHLWSADAPLRRLAEQDKLGAWIFWGPPGSGKTTLARLIAGMTDRPVAYLSAVSAGVKDLRQQIDASLERLESGHKAILLFLDEIHRLNKSQQDVLLPVLEAGTLKMIGATTENPSFEVNAAVLSRSLVFKFEKHSDDELVAILRRAQMDASFKGRTAADEVLSVIARTAGGDARRALALLDALLSAAPAACTRLDMEDLATLGTTLNLTYDKAGDQHYDTISAFIKSIRASHPDAALHYLARMIEAGEDPMFLARRLVIAASEDIGNANPTALLVATSAMQAIHMVGMPEARIILSQATTYLAASPKSNRAYVAIDKALEDVRTYGALEIPLHLRNAPTELMKSFGYGKNYQYAHDEREKARESTYLPDKLKGRKYYEPSDSGAEKILKESLKTLRPIKD